MNPKQLRETLKQLAITQKQAAEILGVTERHFRKWIAGDIPIPRSAQWIIVAHLRKKHGAACRCSLCSLSPLYITN